MPSTAALATRVGVCAPPKPFSHRGPCLRVGGQALCDYVDSGIVLDGCDRPAGCSLRDGSLEVCLRGFKAP